MALYGYARVSSSDQDFALQEQALRAARCDVVRAEKASGTSRTGRTELETLLDFLRRGDTLVVTRIDTDIFNLDGIAGSQRDYIHWLLGVSTGNKVEPGDILTPEAIDMLATKLRTPLQVQLHLTLALEAGY